MAQEQLNIANTGLGFYNPTLPETQDPIGLDLGIYNIPEPMSKEYFGILTTTLDGIVNMLNVFREEVNNEFCYIRGRLANMESKMKHIQDHMRAKEQPKYQPKDQKKDKPKDPRKTNPCYICQELGHWAPDCPRKAQDLCYLCGELGHWANECKQKKTETVTQEKPPENLIPTTVKEALKEVVNKRKAEPKSEEPKKKKALKLKKNGQ